MEVLTKIWDFGPDFFKADFFDFFLENPNFKENFKADFFEKFSA